MNKTITDEQRNRIAEYRERYWRQSTSTEPADRPRAEAAVLALAEIGGIRGEVTWVLSQDEGNAACEAGLALWSSLRYSLWDSLWSSIRDSLRYSLWSSLWSSIRESLRYSLRYSLRESLRESLRYSLWDSLWDTPWTAYYAAARDVCGVTYPERDQRLLHLYEEIAASAFVVWLTPGAIVLCERPAAVEIVDGRLVGITARRG